jgi:hypothetical protein
MSNHEVAKTRIPREASTVSAPKTSGIAAATGERKTSNSTISRNGKAISSPRSLAAIERSCSAREIVAKPVCVTRTGA